MIDRRSFLKVTFAASVAPSASQSALASCADPALAVVVDPACADARQFSAHCASPALSAADPSALMEVLAQEPLRRCFGFGSDSQFFIIEQMAAALGYRLGYHGVHDYRDGRLRHQLTGARAALDELAQSFSLTTTQWTMALARALPSLTRSHTRNTQVAITSNTLCPADSGGFLVSWCLHRA